MSLSCKAKGAELNLWLHTNRIASCCKSNPVLLADLTLDNLVNNPELLRQKNNLDAGVADASCEYCWSNERLNIPSRRTQVNSKPVNKFIEIGFDTTCNFSCLYCGPNYSSKWQSILHHHDMENSHSDLDTNTMRDDYLPIIDEFIHKQGFIRLNITGGEPFLSKNFNRFMDSYVFDPGIVYQITTNLCPDNMDTFNKFFAKTKNCQVIMNISLDTDPDTAASIRLGFDKEQFLKNLSFLYNQDQVVEIKFLNAISCLSLYRLNELHSFIGHQQQLTDKITGTLNSLVITPDYLGKDVIDEQGYEHLKNLIDSTTPYYGQIFANRFEVKNKKILQIKLVKFLLQMEKISGLPLVHYDKLTSGLINRIMTSYGLERDKIL
jgi:organic radical activating enzyme